METNERLVNHRLAAALALLLASATANAADVYLEAGEYTKSFPVGGSSRAVKMWGYRSCDAAWACTGSYTSPGPVINLADSDTTLVLHLKNNLPGTNANIPAESSVVVPYLNKKMAPVSFASGAFAGRIRSFDAEAGAGGTATYTWTNIQPGTYQYHSGTHAAVQVQMGLYGIIVKNAKDPVAADPSGTPAAVLGQAYTGVSYDNSASLVFSEVDPDMHDAIAGVPGGAAPTYGSAAGPTSTQVYSPKFFLINGDSYTTASSALLAATSGQHLLLRLVNAGLENHAPEVQYGHFRVLAEGGKRWPAQRLMTSPLLAPGQSLDVLYTPVRFTSAEPTKFNIFDRRLRTVNDSASKGGMLTWIETSGVCDPATPGCDPDAGAGGGGTGAPGSPTAVADSYTWAEVASQAVPGAGVSPNQGVLANDIDPNGPPPALTASLDTSRPASRGTVSLASDGSFVYTPTDPNAFIPAPGQVITSMCTHNWSGPDVFGYTATNAAGASNALVSVNVTPVDTAPVATGPDFFYASTNAGIVRATSPGFIADDRTQDVDCDPLLAADMTPLAANATTGLNFGTSITAAGDFSATPSSANTLGYGGFTYNVVDAAGNKSATPATAYASRDLRINTQTSIYSRSTGLWTITVYGRQLGAAPAGNYTLQFFYTGGGANTAIGGSFVRTFTALAPFRQITFVANIGLQDNPNSPTTVPIRLEAAVPAGGPIPAHSVSITGATLTVVP